MSSVQYFTQLLLFCWNPTAAALLQITTLQKVYAEFNHF